MWPMSIGCTNTDCDDGSKLIFAALNIKLLLILLLLVLLLLVSVVSATLTSCLKIVSLVITMDGLQWMSGHSGSHTYACLVTPNETLAKPISSPN